MALVSEVADRVFLIARYPEHSIYCFQAFFIDDERPTLIEPGPTSFIPEVLDGLAELGYDVGSLEYVIPTHIHADHCGGTGHLVQHAPDARIIAHEAGARHLVDPARMAEATRVSWGDEYESEIGTPIPVPQERIELVRGGETVSLGDKTLSFVHTPGHAKHHISIYEAGSGVLFCGESLGYMLPLDEVTLLPIVSPPVFDIELALNTVDRQRRLAPSTVLFSHVGVSHDPRRCMAAAEESIRAWGDIVLQAMQNGESQEQIKARLAAIIERLQPGRVELYSRLLDWAATGYTGYFARNGVVSTDREGQ